jgi:hypothetical protein
VLQFYFRLDAIDRENDDIKGDFEHDAEVGGGRAHLVAQRFNESLAPALEALETLAVGVHNCAEIDREAALAYPHVKRVGAPLREALRIATQPGGTPR